MGYIKQGFKSKQTLTAAQLNHIEDGILDIERSGVQQRPLFANSIDECTDTTKLYVLPDGYIYEYKDGQWQNTGHAFIPADYEDRIIDLEDEVITIRDDINNLPSFILDDISTGSFYLKELREVDALKQDTEFISVMNAGVFKSQSAENEITSAVLYKNKEVIRSTTTSDNLTAEFRRAFPTGGFLNILGTQEFDIIVYIDDVTKISKIELKLSTYIDAERGVTQTKTADQLHNGWNYLRFLTTNLPLEQWGECKMLRVLTYTTEPATVYYGDIIQVKPNKARIMFVDDHAYSDFKTNAYPALKEQGIPVTWAIQPGRIGLSIADSGTLLTEEDITELSNDPYSEFSWHSYDGTDTSSMSSAELQIDCKKSITFLRKSGLLPKHYWRAAWKHNNAPNARSCDDLMDGGAYYDTIGRPEVFPFTNKYNISRYSIHRRTQEDIDSIFNILQKTHCTVVFYTHSFITVADDSESNTTNNVTNIEFDYFMNKIATGVSEGWIEGTTFDWLMRKYGIAEF